MKHIRTLALLILFFLTFPLHTVWADTIIFKANGAVLFLSDEGTVANLSLLQDTKNSRAQQQNSSVLGTSAGVSVIVSISSFIPTDTPIPTTHPHPSSIPTAIPTVPTTHPTPPVTIHTQSPSISPPIPTITPANSLIATITTPLTTTTQVVNYVVREFPNESPLVITPSSSSNEMVIQQGNTKATTSLPLQLNSNPPKLTVLTKSATYTVVSPAVAIQKLQHVGSFIIPSSIKIALTTENDKPVYKVTGNQHVLLFNFFLIGFPLTIHIAAINPQQITVENPFIVNLIEFLHIGKRVIH